MPGNNRLIESNAQPNLLAYVNKTARDRPWLLFLAPTMLVLLSVAIYPMLYSITLSLHSWNMGAPTGWRFIGLNNFKMIFTLDTYFWNSAWITLIFTAGTVSAQLVLGMGVALLLNRELKHQGLIRSIIIIPSMISPIVVGLLWRFMYNTDLGIVNYVIELLGFEPINWLGRLNTALVSVMIVDTWEWTPFIALIILAGLQALPQEPYEAARIDGGSSWQIFRYLTLPLLKWTIIVAVLFRLMDSFSRTFDIIFALTKGGPGRSTEILNLYTYRTGFKFFNMGYAAALSWVMLVIIVLISQLFVRYLVKAEEA